MSTIATIHSERNVVSIESLSRSPAMPIGIVPRITSHPSRTSGSPFGTSRLTTDRNHRPMIRVMSFQK